MNCRICGGYNVAWKGRITDLTHTQCADCGGINCQEPEDSPEESDIVEEPRSTIVVERGFESVADFVNIPYVTITDREPLSKRGLTDYRIRGCKMWKNEAGRMVGVWSWWVELDCCWIGVDTCKFFDTLRECSGYVRRYVYDDRQTDANGRARHAAASRARP